MSVLNLVRHRKRYQYYHNPKIYLLINSSNFTNHQLSNLVALVEEYFPQKVEKEENEQTTEEDLNESLNCSKIHNFVEYDPLNPHSVSKKIQSHFLKIIINESSVSTNHPQLQYDQKKSVVDICTQTTRLMCSEVVARHQHLEETWHIFEETDHQLIVDFTSS
jgi:hypothetical protein